MPKKDKLLSGAFTLAVGGFLTKIIGAFYRIPLTNILGAEGIGIYQMVFPLYSLLLTVSSTGVPNGIAKLIAEGNDANSVLKSALLIFLPVGILGFLLMAFFSEKVAILQGNELSKTAYIFISPSVLLVSIISCFRGYYQGFLNMKPTAISQILEQAIKLVFGLALSYLFRYNVALSASLATLAVTISELVTLIYLVLLKKGKEFSFIQTFLAKSDIKPVLRTVFPIMLSTLIMPLSRTVESFIILNVLNGYLNSATSLYGLYSGAVESLVGVPVSVLYSIAVTSVPIISSEKTEKLKKIKKPLYLTVFLSVVFSILFYFLSPFAVKFLYKGLSPINKDITIKMAKIASLSVLFLPIMQTLSASLIASGKLYAPVLTSSVSSTLKIILTFILLKVESINIFAVIITDIVCYLVACFLNLVYIIFINKRMGLKRSILCTN
ncbi:MAG: oligosaccharide flippase family protein [Clostridia bacterium]|nr:oligosaccharide flippase family protein [Clostridia bacterium]